MGFMDPWPKILSWYLLKISIGGDRLKKNCQTAKLKSLSNMPYHINSKPYYGNHSNLIFILSNLREKGAFSTSAM